MNLLQKIKKEQLLARKQSNSTRAKLLTTVIGEADPYGKGLVPDAEVIKVLIKFGKNIDESIKAYKARGVSTLVLESEQSQINEFLPKTMTEMEMVEWIKSNPTKNVGEAMQGVSSYAEANSMLVDRKAFASLLNNA